MAKVASLGAAQMRRFGKVVQDRRRRLFLSLEDVANVAGVTTTFLSQLEAGKARPSPAVAAKLAKALELKLERDFPDAPVDASSSRASAWDKFLLDERLHRIYNITEAEMQTLSGVALMGNLRDSQDFVFVLNTIRKAFADSGGDAEE